MSAGSYAMTDVVARHDDVAAAIIATPDNDMSVRMPGIELVDSHQIERLASRSCSIWRMRSRTKGLRSRKRGLPSAETMKRNWCGSFRAIEKGTHISIITMRIVEPPGLALTGDAIALNVAQIRDHHRAGVHNGRGQ